jgi:hypothetical protein
MGKTLTTLILLALTLIPAAAFPQNLERARISYLENDVQINTKGTEDWFPATVNTPLQEGDRIWVPSGARSEVQIRGGVTVRLDADTSLDILSLEQDSLQFYVNGGRTYINSSNSAIGNIQIETPLSSVSCYDNAIVMIDVTGNGATDLSVLAGYASAESRDGKTRVDADTTLRIEENLAAESLPLGPPDEWAEWNRDRDLNLADAGESLRYLPEELGDYATDFEANGRWLHTSDYGYVWSPMAAFSLDWAPYRIGRWVWISGSYVWISGEHWGWAPYHYGRWVHHPTSGWCWIPPRRGQAHWSPGYVGWVHTPEYVSWVPLAPGDTYYGYGHYGPGSMNVTGFSAGAAGFNLSFRNINVRNAVSVQHRDTFLTGKHVDFRMRENPFARRDVSIGPPTYKPVRQTLSPALRQVQRDHLPPDRLRATRVDALKKQRRVVTDHQGSVFTPGRPAREMKIIKREQPVRLQHEQRPEHYKETNRTIIRGNDAIKERTERERTLRTPARVQPPQAVRPVPAAPAQPRMQTPLAPPAPAVRQPAPQDRQLRNRAVTPAVPVQPQGRPARLERKTPDIQPADTVRQPASQPQPRSLNRVRETAPKAPARVQPPQAVRPVPAAPAQPRMQTPQEPPAQAVRQPATQDRQLRNRAMTPAAPAQPRMQTPQAPPAQAVRQPAATRPPVQQPAPEKIRHETQNSARQDRKQEKAIKQQQGAEAGAREQGGQPAASTIPGRKQGGYAR